MPKKIINIHGRSSTGVSQPFLCESENGGSWFVKRNNVSWDQLVLEFVFGHLAIKFGLPVASFETLEIPEILSKHTLAKDRKDFEPGIAFGSQRVPFGEDFGESHLRHITDDAKMAVICFDWWTSNSDRNRIFMGGSPNLIWDPVMQDIVLIDHDRCFDPDFEPREFLKEHVFRDVLRFMEAKDCQKLRKRFTTALSSLPKIWKQIPNEWHQDESGNSRSELKLDKLTAGLKNPKQGVEGMLSA